MHDAPGRCGYMLSITLVIGRSCIQRQKHMISWTNSPELQILVIHLYSGLNVESSMYGNVLKMKSSAVLSAKYCNY